MSALVPIPKVPIHVRVATMADLPFIDSLQKKYGKALGYFPTKQLEEYVTTGGVLLAESEGSPVGYCISRDRYRSRDELGVIYQLCVAPGVQRGLIGAALVREVFARSAYGCRLYCCWCAKDLEANYFWQAMGFVPLAFRTGGAGSARKKKGRRVHIFWQKRIVEEDTETKWWYPFQTNSGAIRADRIVLPIPPGVRWEDVEPVELPVASGQLPVETTKRLPAPRKVVRDAKANGPGPGKVGILVGGRIKYVDRPGYAPPAAPAPAVAPLVPPLPAKKIREKKPAAKIDPKYLAAARELRDRYLEHVNTSGAMLPAGKYDVSRAIAGPASQGLPSVSIKSLPHAA